MSRLAWQVSPIDGRRRYFRYFDPRISGYLPSLLRPGTWTETLRFLGVSRWLSFDAQGHLVSVQEGQTSQQRSLNDPIRASQLLGREEWLGLERLGWTHRVLQLAHRWDCLYPLERTAVSGIVERAMRWGWTEEPDLLRFAHCALTLNMAFDEHPWVLSRLQALKASGNRRGAFVDMAQSISDSLRGQLQATRHS